MISVLPLAAFTDNYIWVIRHTATRRAVVVDPGDAAVVEGYLEGSSDTLAAILLTHHHADHTGGVEALHRRHAVPVYGPAEPRMPMVSHPLAEGDRIEVLDLALDVFAVPGHTREHIAYFAANPDTADRCPLLFCGDTLFAAGCGRMFEGTAPQMHASLQKLAALPDTTLVYCTHEYTMANLAFARHVLPSDTGIAKRELTEAGKRERGLPTLPSSIALELATNPFLRCTDPRVQDAVQNHWQGTEPATGAAEIFGALRAWKDRF